MKAKTMGSGWHGQTIRHSNARKLGKAGGTYRTLRTINYKSAPYGHIATIPVGTKAEPATNQPKNSEIKYWAKEWKKMTPEEKSWARNYGFGLRKDEVKYVQEDSDGDGVPDHKDCQPNNPHAQDTYELRPIHDNRKSFYGKAKVETEADEEHLTKRLYSYGTLVAEIKDNKPIVHGTYSATTLRHIKEFLKQNGFKAETSKQLLKDYSPSKEETTEAIKEEEEKHKSMMKTTAMVAKLGEVFGKTTEEKNTWKKRMLKAGIPALEFPEDFDKLPEAEKERRLNAVIKQAEKKE